MTDHPPQPIHSPTDDFHHSTSSSDMGAANQGSATLIHRKLIKSFVKRTGRVTTGQAKAIEDLGQQYTIAYQSTPLNIAATFGRAAPVILEIGFGMGDATAHIAQLQPQHDFLCCEVHEPGVGALLKRIGEMRLTNIRIVQHDAVEVLDHMLAGPCLAGIHIFFPDPWHKKRHNKRRLIQSTFVKKLVEKLQIGGYLHCATDWQPYAEQMLEVFQSCDNLQNTSSAYADRPGYRPNTKFENRGLRLGHGVWDLVFTRKI
jgi:tRNA (guanine-N7-)-methyltransferase